MEIFKRGKLVLRKLGRNETRYFLRAAYKLVMVGQGFRSMVEGVKVVRVSCTDIGCNEERGVTDMKRI